MGQGHSLERHTKEKLSSSQWPLRGHPRSLFKITIKISSFCKNWGRTLQVGLFTGQIFGTICFFLIHRHLLKGEVQTAERSCLTRVCQLGHSTCTFLLVQNRSDSEVLNEQTSPQKTSEEMIPFHQYPQPFTSNTHPTKQQLLHLTGNVASSASTQEPALNPLNRGGQGHLGDCKLSASHFLHKARPCSSTCLLIRVAIGTEDLPMGLLLQGLAESEIRVLPLAKVSLHTVSIIHGAGCEQSDVAERCVEAALQMVGASMLLLVTHRFSQVWEHYHTQIVSRDHH